MRAKDFRNLLYKVIEDDIVTAAILRFGYIRVPKTAGKVSLEGATPSLQSAQFEPQAGP